MATFQWMIRTTDYTDREKTVERGIGVARKYYAYSMQQSTS